MTTTAYLMPVEALPARTAPDVVVVRTAAAPRVTFVDLARAAAILFMVQGHSLNVLLAPGYEDHPIFQGWLFLRGLTSCTFLLLSGFAFAIATDRYWAANLQLSARVVRRLRRFAFFVFLGYTLRFPVSRIDQFQFLGAEGWRGFLIVDILQCIGMSLLLLQALVVVTRTRERFALTTAVLAAAIVALTQTTWSIDWTVWLPVGVAAYLTPTTGSLFPMMPWAAYLLAGAALGSAYVRIAATDREWFARWILLAGGAAMAAVGVLLEHSGAIEGGPTPWSAAPGTILVRLGCVLVLLFASFRVTAWLGRLPAVLSALAQESLLIYYIHIVILYGSPWSLGLQQWVGRALGLPETAAWIGALWVSMILLAFFWHQVKRQHVWVARLVKIGLAAAFLGTTWQ